MLAINQVLQNRYVIVGKLGEGGMGTVYEATDLRLKNTVALKETKLHEDRLLEAFAQEAELLAKLRHPGLPRVIDHFVEGEGQFLVMEFIPGDDLESRVKMRGRAFDPNQVLDWGDQLLEILHYLHTRTPPIIHRDVKPLNLKLTDDDKIVLLDFGLAKSLQTGTLVKGCSINYSPLEQMHATATDARSDLYSFAATLYYLMTARKPADAESRREERESGRQDPLKPIAEVNSLVSLTVSAVLMRAMALDSRDRPSTASELRRLLSNAREAQYDTAPTIVAGEAPRRFEVLLSEVRGATPPTQSFNTPAAFEQPPADLKLGTSAGMAEARNSKPRPSDRSGETTLMSKVRNWEARHYRVMLAQLLMAILAIALTLFIYMNSRTSEGKPSPNPSADAGGAGTKEPPKPTKAEAMSYYLELKDGRKTAMAGGDLLSSDQRFKFHFMSAARGFLYIIAPGDGNVPMTFLTNRPTPDSGVSTNAVEPGSDYQFPSGNWIGLRDDSYKTPFTIIFSPVRLTAPGFLEASAGRTLPLAEQKEFEKFVADHKADKVELTSEAQNNGAAMKLSVPVEQNGRVTLVFQIEVGRR